MGELVIPWRSSVFRILCGVIYIRIVVCCVVSTPSLIDSELSSELRCTQQTNIPHMLQLVLKVAYLPQHFSSVAWTASARPTGDKMKV